MTSDCKSPNKIAFELPDCFVTTNKYNQRIRCVVIYIDFFVVLFCCWLGCLGIIITYHSSVILNCLELIA